MQRTMAAHRHPDPLLLSMVTPLRASFYPLGFRLEIETNDARVLECASSSFAAFTQEQEQEQSPAPPLQMRLVCAPGGTSAPPWPAPTHRLWGDLFTVISGPDNFLAANLERRKAMGFFSPAMLDDIEYFREPFLECPTYVLLARHYVTPFHAACVVRGGAAICLCGPAGAGKSSLAYFCVRSGYQLLANDAVYLLRSETRPLLRGNPSRFTFPPSARELFPELAGLPAAARRDGEASLSVATAHFFPARAVTQAEVGAVVFLNRGAALALKEIPAGEAHKLLFEELSLDDDRTIAAHDLALQRLVQKGAYRLSYTTLQEGMEQLDRLPLRQRTQG